METGLMVNRATTLLDRRSTMPCHNSSIVNLHSSIIRPAVTEDLTSLLGIETACFADPWASHTLLEALQDERTLVFVATVAGQVRGYGVAWTVFDEGDLTRLVVDPMARRWGLGACLTQALLQECQQRGAQRVFLEVRVSNEQARRLYERQGFKQVGLRRNYYGNGEDAVVMKTDLTTNEHE